MCRPTGLSLHRVGCHDHRGPAVRRADHRGPEHELQSRAAGRPTPSPGSQIEDNPAGDGDGEDVGRESKRGSGACAALCQATGESGSAFAATRRPDSTSLRAHRQVLLPIARGRRIEMRLATSAPALGPAHRASLDPSRNDGHFTTLITPTAPFPV